MKRFLDAVNSDKMLTYLELLFENYVKVLLVLGIVSYFMTEYHITAFCIILYGIIILTKRNNAYIISKRISAYDADTPKLLQDMIDECIKENYLYEYAGVKDPYINDVREISMNHSVLDLILLRLDKSVMMDKFRLYYGEEFEDILSRQVNMAIALFVLDKNTKPITKKTKPGSTGLRSSEKSTEELLKDIGISVIK